MKTTFLKYIIASFSLLLCFFLISSCQKEDVKYHTAVSLQQFNKIEIYSAFDVFLKEDTVFSIEAVGRRDVVENLIFTVQNGILKVEDPRKSEWRTPKSNKVELHISSPPLFMLTTFESCNIETTNPITSVEFGLVLGGKAGEANLDLNCGIFFYWGGSVTGGKILLRGKTNSLKLWNSGLIQVDAKELITSYALVENKSRGNCEVKVLDKLDYSIFNSGNIILYGQPVELNNVAGDATGIGRLMIE